MLFGKKQNMSKRSIKFYKKINIIKENNLNFIIPKKMLKNDIEIFKVIESKDIVFICEKKKCARLPIEMVYSFEFPDLFSESESEQPNKSPLSDEKSINHVDSEKEQPVNESQLSNEKSINPVDSVRGQHLNPIPLSNEKSRNLLDQSFSKTKNKKVIRIKKNKTSFYKKNMMQHYRICKLFENKKKNFNTNVTYH